MSVRQLDRMFEPRSIAIVGASLQPGRIGTTVLANMAESGFAGALWPVNPKYDELLGIPCYPRVAALPKVAGGGPDLAVVCTPPDTVPGLIGDLGARGTRAVIVLTPLPPAVRQAMLKAARPYQLRILGPGGIGLVAPAAGLNASVAHVGARPGRIAFVSQSGMLMTAVLDWARQQSIGFSRVVSLGESVDIDVGDLLDFLAGDADTSAIVLHLESIGNARKFLSAARIAARGKPVVVLKSGREGDDRVVDAAIRRAGMLRVHSSADLFDAVETVARARPLAGERLGVICNGTSLALLASDALDWIGGQLATLSPETVRRLRPHVPDGMVPANPLDIGVRADTARHAAALAAMLAEPQADALLLVHAPTSAAGSTEVAQALAPLIRAGGRSVLSCWLGGEGVQAARKVFADANLPTYDTPEKAVRAFGQIVQYQRNQALLIEVPRQEAAAGPADEARRLAARQLVREARAAGQARLDAAQARSVLAAYDLVLADGGPCDAGRALLRIAMDVDPVFGPAISFGLGGAAGHAAGDRAVGLPPLNTVLARDIVQRSRAGRALQGQATAADGVHAALVAVAQLAADLDEVAALRLDPVQPADAGLLVLDAVVELGPARPETALAIRPYPQALEETVAWQGMPLLLRPIRPEDAPAHVRFFAALDPDDVRMRFFTALRELPPAQLARLTQIDYDRAMAFIATRTGADGQAETLGVVRAVADPDNAQAEFAITIRSDLKGQGLGTILFRKLVEYFRDRGTAGLTGEALAENVGVQQLVKRFGGRVLPGAEPGTVELALQLNGGLHAKSSEPGRN
ncbi:GNAT family N-acetyltransferase [[Empedobacter] haloabium]|uniref:GNAT family N-acetyltransferase n=1 Tax=[Empedobacter] haloabium TaxID=592317 RepID=A0ABZ1UHA2_9BURK